MNELWSARHYKKTKRTQRGLLAGGAAALISPRAPVLGRPRQQIEVTSTGGYFPFAFMHLMALHESVNCLPSYSGHGGMNELRSDRHYKKTK
ncbi:MAG TPA: hypothetical protein VN788_07035, partial [Verrucomicrobiae bacterium]|nr:hypothetical protein [Verrucomicrobiae bacterium]